MVFAPLSPVLNENVLYPESPCDDLKTNTIRDADWKMAAPRR